MDKGIFEFVWDMLSYILSIELSQIPLHIAYVAIIGLVSYCGSMILISFPCSVYESITKKKINDDIQDKIIRIVAICLGIVLFTRLLYEKMY